MVTRNWNRKRSFWSVFERFVGEGLLEGTVAWESHVARTMFSARLFLEWKKISWFKKSVSIALEQREAALLVIQRQFQIFLLVSVLSQRSIQCWANWSHLKLLSLNLSLKHHTFCWSANLVLNLCSSSGVVIGGKRPHAHLSARVQWPRLSSRKIASNSWVCLDCFPLPSGFDISQVIMGNSFPCLLCWDFPLIFALASSIISTCCIASVSSEIQCISAAILRLSRLLSSFSLHVSTFECEYFASFNWA